MADQRKIGKPWQADELDAIVADYFTMLALELSGTRYVKSRHSAALMSQIGRTHRSVEFKHQNISAALDELGLPWIPGYIPKRNYQSAILDAIDRFLTQHPEALNPHWSHSHPPAGGCGVFVDPPAAGLGPRLTSAPMERLVRKFDPVTRDYRNRALGRAGEEFVIRVEQQRLRDAGRGDLARKIRWTAVEDGDGAGYDVFSFEPDGQERLLEVKTTNGAAQTPFFLTRNERSVAEERPAEWRIYRVHCFAQCPRIFKIVPPLEESLHLAPAVWRASVSSRLHPL